MATYPDRQKCPKGHTFTIDRRETTTGKVVKTYCRMCQISYPLKAGPLPKSKGQP